MLLIICLFVFFLCVSIFNMSCNGFYCHHHVGGVFFHYWNYVCLLVIAILMGFFYYRHSVLYYLIYLMMSHASAGINTSHMIKCWMLYLITIILYNATFCCLESHVKGRMKHLAFRGLNIIFHLFGNFNFNCWWLFIW